MANTIQSNSSVPGKLLSPGEATAKTAKAELFPSRPTVEIVNAPVSRIIPDPYSPDQAKSIYTQAAALFSEVDQTYKPSAELCQLRATTIASFSRIDNAVMLAEFVSNMLKWELRAFESLNKNAEAEIYQSYEGLQKLLDSPASERSLPWQSRCLAANQFMIHAASPETVSQGRHLAAHVTCVIHKIFTGQPSRFAQMICDLALTGQWYAFDGMSIVLSESSIKPGLQELIYKSGDDLRSYACKLIQQLLLNNCLQRRNNPVFYSESPGRPGRNYLGQKLASKDGSEVPTKGQTDLTFLEMELLLRFEFGESNSIIVNDCSFAADSLEAKDKNNANILIHINSKEDLSDALEKASRENKLPISIAVDERKLLAESYQDGINHVINVTDFNEYGSLRIFNPHTLPGMQRHAKISLQKLYNASLSSFSAS